MPAIEKIAVEVPSEVAEAYRRATETQRSLDKLRIGLMLRAATFSRQDTIVGKAYRR
jgi:hypothetical protein